MVKKFLRDDVASKLFSDDSLRDYVILVISGATDIDVKTLEETLHLDTPRINELGDKKQSYADVVYKTDEAILNIEINFNYSGYVMNKNLRYVCHLLLSQVNQGMKDIYNKVIQINIDNFDYFGKNKFLYKSYLIEASLVKKRSDLLEIIDINMDYLRKLSYNKIKQMDEVSLERLLYLFICEDEKVREEIIGDDGVMKKVNDKMVQMTQTSTLYYDHDEFLDNIRYELGQTDAKKEMAQNMFQDGLSKEAIAKYLRLPLEKVMEFLQDIKESKDI